MRKLLALFALILLLGMTACQQEDTESSDLTYGVEFEAPEVIEEPEVLLSSEDVDWSLFNNGVVLFSYPEHYTVNEAGDRVNVSDNDLSISFYPVSEAVVLGGSETIRSDYWREFSRKADEWVVMEAYTSDLKGLTATHLFLLEEIYSTLSVL